MATIMQLHVFILLVILVLFILYLLLDEILNKAPKTYTTGLNVPDNINLRFERGASLTISTDETLTIGDCVCGNPARVLLNDINLCFFCYNDFIQRSKEREYCKYCGRGIKRND
jgi:hypothetical protein